MNAIKFIQQYGVEKAREVVEGAPEFPVFGYCALTGSYIFKRKDATAYYHNETNSWSEEYAIELILLDDLKRLVESVDLVTAWGGLESTYSKFRYAQEHKNTYAANMIQQAIADCEQLFGNTETLELETLRDCDTSPNCKKYNERVK